MRAAQDVTPTMATVAAAVGAPEFILPWLDRFYDEEDGELVLAAAARPAKCRGRPATAQTASPASTRHGSSAPSAVASSTVTRPARTRRPTSTTASRSGRCSRAGRTSRSPSIGELAEWDVGAYAEKIREDVEAVRDGRPGDSYEARYAYVLLSEAEAIVAAQEHIYLWPCDCRSLTSRCRKPMDVCLRFENDRGLGWEISKERAVAILRSTDKAGLMHTADLHDDPRDTSAICNCCTDCCYPHLATERLGMGDVWPVRRHVARIDADLCNACGRCGRRCPFAAIVCDDRRAAGARSLAVPRLRSVRHGLQQRGHRAAAARRGAARRAGSLAGADVHRAGPVRDGAQAAKQVAFARDGPRPAARLRASHPLPLRRPAGGHR